MKLNKITKMLIAVFAVTALCIPTTVNAKASQKDSGQVKKIIFQSKEITDKTELFNLAKNQLINSNSLKSNVSQSIEKGGNASQVVEKDENGNIIYKATQKLQVYEDQNGQRFEKFTITSFKKIDNDSNKLTNKSAVPGSMKGDGQWDSSKSAYLYSTIHYTKTNYNNRDCVKLDSASGGEYASNSGVNLYSLQVTLICEGMGVGNQRKTTSCSNSFNLDAPSNWIPVPAVFGRWGSMVGCQMSATLGRSSSRTWTYNFSVTL